MKKILLVSLTILSAVSSHSQTTATNFTATDCNSNSHTLFTELDNGKVVVLAWIMPCVTCIAPVKTAYNIAKAYNNKPEYAGRVLFYLIDDFGDQNCTYLSNWANNNNIGPDMLSIFDNAPGGNVIKENDYGGTGMPHVAIVGGSDHKILFNKFNNDANDATGIELALFSALTPVSVQQYNSASGNLAIYPNPASTILNLGYNANNNVPLQYDIYNAIGINVLSAGITPAAGKNTAKIDISRLDNGVYFIRVNTGTTSKTMRFIVQHK